MLYRKNLPIWERGVRALAVLFMAACAWHFGRTPVGYAFVAAAVVTLVTALIGWCPACAMGGRKAIGGA